VIATYAYNHNSLRKSKTVSGVTTTYNWDASGNLIRETTSGASTYFYWVGGKLVGLKKNGTIYIVHNNLRGDVESITDLNGNIVAQAHYDPWGNSVAGSGSLVQPFRYAGYYYDDETGLYYLKSRYYSPALGRFLTRDGIGYISYSNPQTLNLYTYAGNNPVSLVDPNGNWASEAERKWAEKHWSKEDYDAVDNYGNAWQNSNKTMRRFYHGKANEIRAKYPKFREIKTIEQSVKEVDLSSVPSDIWKGMSCEGWQPYKNLAYSVANAHAGAVSGFVLGKIIPSTGDTAVDKANEQLGYASLLSPSNWTNLYEHVVGFFR